MSQTELLHWLKKLYQKYQVPYGIAIWGFKSDSTAKEILVDDQGRLVISGTITATVDKVKIWDGTDYLEINADGSINIGNLPTDYAKESQLPASLTASGNLKVAIEESITVPVSGSVSITNFPTDYPDSGTHSRLDDLKGALASVGTDKIRIDDAGGSITVDGTIDVGNFPTDYPDSGSHSRLDTIHGDLYDSTETKTITDILKEMRDQVATETTLSSIKTQTDKLTFDGSSYLYVNAAVVSNPPNLDVLLSSRASESTLSSVDSKLGDLRGALASVGTDRLRIDDAGGSITIDNANIDGYLPNLDVALSTRASETSLLDFRNRFHYTDFDTGSGIVNRIAVGIIVPGSGGPVVVDPRDRNWTITETVNVAGSVTVQEPLSVDDGGGSLTIDNTNIDSYLPNLDVALSTRASETTLSGVKAQTDKLTFDGSNYLRVNVSADTVGLAKDSTLSSFSGKFPSATALADSLSNPTTTIVGAALLGWDSAGGVWERLKTDGSGRLLLWLG